jgi:hypothetical protein
MSTKYEQILLYGFREFVFTMRHGKRPLLCPSVAEWPVCGGEHEMLLSQFMQAAITLSLIEMMPDLFM